MKKAKEYLRKNFGTKNDEKPLFLLIYEIERNHLDIARFFVDYLRTHGLEVLSPSPPFIYIFASKKSLAIPTRHVNKNNITNYDQEIRFIPLQKYLSRIEWKIKSKLELELAEKTFPELCERLIQDFLRKNSKSESHSKLKS